MVTIFKAEMNDSSKHLCRLCLKKIPACECETIEEAIKEKLRILLINIDFDVSDYAVACNRCLEAVQDCFDFKSHVTTFVGVDMKVDIKKVFQREIAISENNCRLCMSPAGDEAFNDTADCKDAVFLKHMITHCLPEVDISTDHEPIICKLCLSSIKKYYELIKTCREVEQRIRNYCQVVGSYGKVVLADVFEFRNCDTLSIPVVIKTEFSDVSEMLIVPKEEHTESIKCEEVDIKDELDNGGETIQSDQSADCDTSGKNGSSTNKRSASKEEKPMYGCPKCPYSSNRSNNIKGHIMRTHSNNKAHKCFLCPFVTDAKLLLKDHMTSHRGSSKALSCWQCPYETDIRSHLVRHFLKHKDTPEVDMYTCPLCSYQTKYKAAVKTHQMLWHERTINVYKCEECSFSTKHTRSFWRHQLRHRNPKEVPKHKCEKCEFESKHKFSLIQHMIMHEDPEVANKFKCEKCVYRGKRRRDLKRHVLVHSEKHQSGVETVESAQSNDCNSSRNSDSSNEKTAVKKSASKEENHPMYFCPKCSYSSNRKDNIKLHDKRIHLNNKAHKCSLCPFVADTRLVLKVHMKSHKGANKVFGCHECPYETNHKPDLVKHVLKHKDKSEVKMYECALCPYKSKYKPEVVKHRKLQHDENVKMYKCDRHKCEFETKYRGSLLKHLLRHGDAKAAIDDSLI